ncbi:MAG TPA: nuclease-related domain-containing protein [Solirubrobacteraceae bacterium]
MEPDRQQTGPPLDTGTAGASARREHQRRRANREQRVRQKHPRLGGVILRLSDDPTHESAWARGADGEEHVARILAKHVHETAIVLHDRRIPRSRANIDHLAVARSGVWVIDAKRYTGRVAVSNRLFGAPKLTIGGRDKSRLVDGLAKQVALVEAVVASMAPSVPVRGALCFVDADLPLLGNLSFDGYPLLHPKRLAKRINAGRILDAERVYELAAELTRRFPPA